MKGHFISVEGTDGAGKTTQIQKIIAYLEKMGKTVVFSREPGGTLIGEKIRGILLDANHTTLSDRTEILLYAAARSQHLEEKILPAIEEGKVVLCDRFSDSSIAYQGYGRNLGEDLVERVNAEATGGVLPEITLYLDIPPEKAMERKRKERNHTLDRMEQEEMAFHQRVYEGYRKLWKKYPQRIRRIDATGDMEEVFTQIKKELDAILNL